MRPRQRRRCRLCGIEHLIVREAINRLLVDRDNVVIMDTEADLEYEIVETPHRAHAGVDDDYKNLINVGLKTYMGDGGDDAMIATEMGHALV